jgi:hypothetical protein
MAGLNFQHYKGDTFEEVAFQILVDNVALNLTNCVLTMQLREECGGLIALNLTTVSSAGLTITNAAQGRFKINKQIIDIDSGNYQYDIQLKLANNDVKTYIKGEFLIECDITRV